MVAFMKRNAEVQSTMAEFERNMMAEFRTTMNEQNVTTKKIGEFWPAGKWNKNEQAIINYLISATESNQ